MCVIMLADSGVRPTAAMIEQGFTKNPAGAGAAWREDGEVKWAKGLDRKEILELAKHLPFPFVLHFRQPSHNTAVGPKACHPFPVEDEVSIDVKGTTKKGVLFHNGFWSDWRNKLIETAINGYVTLPGGGWTDTRGLAWMTAHLGPGILEMINEKVVLFAPKELLVFGDGWELFNPETHKKCDAGETGVWVSNLQFVTGGGVSHHTGFTRRGVGYHTTPPHSLGGGHSVSGDTTKEGTGGSSQPTSFRGTGQPAESQEDQQKRIQAAGQGHGGTGVAGGQTSKGATQGWEAGKEAQKIVDANKVCSLCPEENPQVWSNGVAYCWSCWHLTHPTSGVTGESFVQGTGRTVVPITGKCESCNTYSANHRTLHGGHAICGACWLKNGRPSIESSSGKQILNRAHRVVDGVMV